MAENVTLTRVAQVFGAPLTDIGLSSFYRGGEYIPDTPAYSGIPTSGAISLSTLIDSVISLKWDATQGALVYTEGDTVNVTLPTATRSPTPSAVSYSLVGAPVTIAFDPTTRKLTGTAATAGSYLLRYSASAEDADTITQEIGLTINAAPFAFTAPRSSSIGPRTLRNNILDFSVGLLAQGQTYGDAFPLFSTSDFSGAGSDTLTISHRHGSDVYSTTVDGAISYYLNVNEVQVVNNVGSPAVAHLDRPQPLLENTGPIYRYDYFVTSGMAGDIPTPPPGKTYTFNITTSNGTRHSLGVMLVVNGWAPTTPLVGFYNDPTEGNRRKTHYRLRAAWDTVTYTYALT